MTNFEVASSSSCGDTNKSFRGSEVSGGVNAICSRPEVDDDVVSGSDVTDLRINL